MTDTVDIFDPKALERMFDLGDGVLDAEGLHHWPGPFGDWSTKPYQRGSKIFTPFRPGMYRTQDGELSWNIPEILTFWGLPQTAENKAAVVRTLEGVALATGKELVLNKSDA